MYGMCRCQSWFWLCLKSVPWRGDEEQKVSTESNESDEVTTTEDYARETVTGSIFEKVFVKADINCQSNIEYTYYNAGYEAIWYVLYVELQTR